MLDFLIAGSISGVVVGSILDKQEKAAKEARNAEQIKLLDQIQHCIEAKNYREAIGLIKTFMNRKGTSSPLDYMTLGSCYDGLVHIEEPFSNATAAIRCYDKALELYSTGMYVDSHSISEIKERLVKLSSFLKFFDKEVKRLEKLGLGMKGDRTRFRSLYGRMMTNRIRNPEILKVEDQYTSDVENDRWKRAFKHANELIKLEPVNGEHYVRRASCKMAFINLTGALEDMEIALRYGLVDKRRNEAEELLREVIKPQMAHKLRDKAVKAGEAGHYNEAITCFNEVISIDPDYWFDYFYRGKAKWLIGDKTNATLDFKKALSYELPSKDRKQLENSLRKLGCKIPK